MVNVGQSHSVATEFMIANSVDLLCLLDEHERVYDGYYRPDAGLSESPIPLQVVVDRAGIITSIDTDLDPDSTRALIDAALAR